MPSPVSVIIANSLAPRRVRIALRYRTLNQSASCPLARALRAARWRFGVTLRAPCELFVATVTHANAGCHRTPLMRFISLQRDPTATRCSRQPAPNDPASALFTGLRPARPRTFVTPASPMRFSALRMCLRSCLVCGCWCSPLRSRTSAGAKRRDHITIRSHVRALIGETESSALTTIRHIKRHRNTLAVRPWSCTKRFLCAVFRYHVEPSRPGWMTGPSLLQSSSGAHGIFTLRRFGPANRWNRISVIPGPRAVRIRNIQPD